MKTLSLYKQSMSFIQHVSGFFLTHTQCRFQPTCSEYSVAAVEKYGFFIGFMYTAWRILRCNPFTRPGVDLP